MGRPAQVRLNWLIAGVCTVLLNHASAAEPDAATLYNAHCAGCHGADRLGGTGPALLPDNLQRLRKDNAATVIAGGLPATQMPAFAGKLDAQQVDALVTYIYSSPATDARVGRGRNPCQPRHSQA